MKRPITIMLTAATLSAFNTSASFTRLHGIEDAHIKRVAVSPTRPSFVAVASANSLYIRQNHEAAFSKELVLKDEQIRHLVIGRDSGSSVYLAGTRNCYKIGTRVERIFSADDGETINFIIHHKSSIYVATTAGLYYADEIRLNWTSLPGLRNNEVFSMDGFGDTLYLACSDGVYLLRKNGILRRLFAVRNDDETDDPESCLIKVDPMTPARLWLCTGKGVFCSNDWGETWRKFFIAGADTVSVRHLSQGPLEGNSFHICTDAGLFKVAINDGSSRNLFEGLSTTRINWMDFTTSGEIYLATDHGVFTSESPPARLIARGGLQAMVKKEPPIQKVQDAALRYNSVHPEKIEKWRRRLTYRALFPKVSVDYDNNIRGSSVSGHYYFSEGPHEWGVSLSWDVGNLIWNTYEDDIDNRNKLTAQLRMDILDEINRIYFERLRLKQEIEAASDTGELSLKELRLMELNATLDGYTGGYFSRTQNHARL